MSKEVKFNEPEYTTPQQMLEFAKSINARGAFLVLQSGDDPAEMHMLTTCVDEDFFNRSLTVIDNYVTGYGAAYHPEFAGRPSASGRRRMRRQR